MWYDIEDDSFVRPVFCRWIIPKCKAIERWIHLDMVPGQNHLLYRGSSQNAAATHEHGSFYCHLNYLWSMLECRVTYRCGTSLLPPVKCMDHVVMWVAGEECGRGVP